MGLGTRVSDNAFVTVIQFTLTEHLHAYAQNEIPRSALHAPWDPSMWSIRSCFGAGGGGGHFESCRALALATLRDSNYMHVYKHHVLNACRNELKNSSHHCEQTKQNTKVIITSRQKNELKYSV